MTLTPAQLLAAADRVRDAATRPRSGAALERTDLEEPLRNTADKSEPHPAHTAAARRAWLAAERRDLERTARAFADLPRRRGTAPKR